MAEHDAAGGGATAERENPPASPWSPAYEDLLRAGAEAFKQVARTYQAPAEWVAEKPSQHLAFYHNEEVHLGELDRGLRLEEYHAARRYAWSLINGQDPEAKDPAAQKELVNESRPVVEYLVRGYGLDGQTPAGLAAARGLHVAMVRVADELGEPGLASAPIEEMVAEREAIIAANAAHEAAAKAAGARKEIGDHVELAAALGLGDRRLDEAGMLAARRIGGYLQLDELDAGGEWADASLMRSQAVGFRLSIGEPGAEGMAFDTLEGSYPADRRQVEAFAERHPELFGSEARQYVDEHARELSRDVRRDVLDDDGPGTVRAEYAAVSRGGGEDDEDGEEPEEEDDGPDADEDEEERTPAEREAMRDWSPAIDDEDERPTEGALRADGNPVRATAGRPTAAELAAADAALAALLEQPPARTEDETHAGGRRHAHEQVDHTQEKEHRMASAGFTQAEGLLATDGSLQEALASGAKITPAREMRGRVSSLNEEATAKLSPEIAQDQAEKWERGVASGKFENWQHKFIRMAQENVPDLNRAGAKTVGELYAEDWRQYERVASKQPGEQYVRVESQDGSYQQGIIKRTEKGIDRDGTWFSVDAKGNTTQIAEFQNGELHGTVRNYAQNARLLDRTDYKQGQRDGLAFVYDEEGRIREKVTYEAGKEVAREDRSDQAKVGEAEQRRREVLGGLKIGR